MGKKVNVILSDGKTVSVDEEEAAKLRPQDARTETPVQGAERNVQEYNRENTSGVRAAAEGALDTLSLGAYGKLHAALAGDNTRLEATAQSHPVARAVGEVGGLLAPYGVLGDAAKVATEWSGVGAAAKLGESGSLVGRAAEGALLGVGGRVAESNVSGDPLSIEGLVQDIGVGSILNVAFGAAADRIGSALAKSAGRKASSSVGAGLDGLESKAVTGATPSAESIANAASERYSQFVEKGPSLSPTEAKAALEDSPTYANVKAAYESAQQDAKAFNADATKQAAAYEKSTTTKALSKTLSAVEEQQNVLRVKVGEAARAGDAETLKQHDALLKSLTKANQEARQAMKTGGNELAAAILERAGQEGRAGGLLIPEMPAKPPGLKSVGPKLPDTLFDLGKARKETLAEIANHSGPEVKAELDKLSSEMAFEPGETAGDSWDTLGTRVREDYVLPFQRGGESEASKFSEASKAVDTARGKGSYSELTGEWAQPGEEEAKSILDKPIAWSRKAAVMSAARAVDVGGWTGAILRSMAASAAGHVLGGIGGAVMGASLLGGKLGVVSKVGQAISMFGKPLESVVKELGPVTASLYAHFPSGEPDKETEDSKVVSNRMADISAASQTAPDSMFEALRPLMGEANDVALKLHQKLLGGLKYLSAMAPKDPGINVTMTGSAWEASFRQVDEWAHRYEAVLHPFDYIARVLSGDGHPSGVEALQFQWPAILQETLDQSVSRDWSKLSMEESRGWSQLFQQPLTGLQHPDVGLLIQSAYLPKPDTSASGAKQAKSGGGANGRPPAVDSKIAGSNAGLLTQ